ncbi:hypothetical protein [Saccharothrix australiensis]|uniref:Uncharacterized protein n=1 Tax=Saccharothrix australiensis TaxID=2072 RepID=A0A495VZI1_9PSEU|nr:hypothetical protein [Saccharothrix australiensis]RKT54280.1 hypothetical protein C8E97_2896 [Saccharothrix australiensis]
MLRPFALIPLRAEPAVAGTPAGALGAAWPLNPALPPARAYRAAGSPMSALTSFHVDRGRPGGREDPATAGSPARHRRARPGS